MVDRITIQRIANGFITGSVWEHSKDHTLYHKDMEDVVKHLDTVWGKKTKE